MLWILSLAWAGPCDVGAVDELVEALDHVRSDMRVELASAGLAQACPGHAGLAGAAAMIPQMPPAQRSMIDAKAVADDPMLWLGVCEGGLEVAAKTVQVAPSEKRPLLWRECGLSEKGWFSEQDWTGAQGLVFVSLMAGQALKKSSFDDQRTRAVVRGLAGIGGKDGGMKDHIGGLLPPPPPIEEEELIMPELDTGLVAPINYYPPSFVERPQVKWNGAAKKAKKKVCKVEVTVRKGGELGKIDWVECPEPLRKSVEKALNKAEFEVGHEEGQPVKGSFKTRFTVR